MNNIHPSQPDLLNAIRNANQCVLDPVLQKCVSRKRKTKPNEPLMFAGAYSCVFAFDGPNNTKYALRCWHTDIGDQKLRYKLINDYLTKVKLPYFIHFRYVEQGIIARSARRDVVRMEWRDEPKLKAYIKENLMNPSKLDDLCSNFLSMFKALHRHDISHGDLQHENILVNKAGEIILIDYDSLYTTSMGVMPDIVKGLPGYQHPSRLTKCKYSSVHVDYFSELVIYLSLRAIIEKPTLWNDCDVEKSDDLLFCNKDFVQPSTSSIFRTLKTMSKEIQGLADQLIAYCNTSDLHNLKPFEDTYTSIADEIIAKFPKSSPRPAPPKDPDASEEIIRKFKIIKTKK